MELMVYASIVPYRMAVLEDFSSTSCGLSEQGGEGACHMHQSDKGSSIACWKVIHVIFSFVFCRFSTVQDTSEVSLRGSSIELLHRIRCVTHTA